MDRDADFDMNAEGPPNSQLLEQDLELDTLCKTMARGDKFLYDVTKKALLLGLADARAIVYRQQALADVVRNPETVKAVYGLALEAIVGRRRIWGWHSDYVDSVLRSSVETLSLFFDVLKRLRQVADSDGGRFESEAFTSLFATIGTQLDDAYLTEVGEHLRELSFPEGERMRAALGAGLKGEGYTLTRFPIGQRGWIQRLLRRKEKYSFEVAPQDEAGHRALSDLRNRSTRESAKALRESTDHILCFFTALRTELAFYIGCLNLMEALQSKGEPTCIPSVSQSGTSLTARGLYDPSLAMKLKGQRVVGSDIAADGKPLIIVTGANQGGKSTFLRALGIAYVMTQAGLFVPAEEFSVGVATGIFTHYKREEDASMTSGKFDEELSRMSQIVSQIQPGCVLLCNESFSSTNEREGSQIGSEVIHALVASGIRICLVTHLFELAQTFRSDSVEPLYLRAQRGEDGLRTFRIVEGEPLPTSHGQDLYVQTFRGIDKTLPQPS